MAATPADPTARPQARSARPDAREALTVRRNLLVGLWAARRLGLRGTDAYAYACRVHLADFDEPGPDDVVAKVASDLARAGARACESTIRRLLRGMEARAARELSARPL